MKAIRYVTLALAIMAPAGVRAAADVNDPWVTMKARIILRTTDGVTSRDINVDSVNGAVTLHGKVPTAAERDRAALAVKDVEGVKSVTNLLQVVPESARKSVSASDEIIKARVQATLGSVKDLEGISVASVNKGVVLLSGRARTLAEKQRAIELAAGVDGVARVATEIETAR